MLTPYIVGITGGSGSGKTYFLSQLAKDLGDENICMLSHDNYYKDRELQPKDENGYENFDTPESLDLNAFAEDIAKLKNGIAFDKEEYTFNNKDVIPKILHFSPRPIIIVEGIFVFHNQKVRDMIDLKLFIDAKPHVKIKRRILRDNVERGYDLNDVLYRYENHVMPAYEKYIEIHKSKVDMVICNDHGFDTALDVVSEFLQKQLKKRLILA